MEGAVAEAICRLELAILRQALWQDWTLTPDRHLIWVVQTATGDE